MKVPEPGVKYFIWSKSNKKNYGELVSDILNKEGIGQSKYYCLFGAIATQQRAVSLAFSRLMSTPPDDTFIVKNTMIDVVWLKY